MRDPINDQCDLPGQDDTSGRKTWRAPSLLRLDAECAENAVTPGTDGVTSAS
jgi:hypothetical protein